MWSAATARAAPCASRIGRALHGDSANHAWGVMDVLAVTDFPDVRFKSLIQSANDGSIIIIPREGGYLFRLYIELDKLGAGERVSNRNITADDLIAAARRILKPHTLDVKEIAWWSVYEIGQRLCDKFDDVPEEDVAERLPRVFIAGDACHTHSPKAGPGHERLDAGRLQPRLEAGFGAAQALRAAPPAHLLGGASGHRQGADRLRSRMGRMLVHRHRSKGFDPAETQSYFVRHGRYTAGTATRYRPSLLTGEATHQHLAEGLDDRHALSFRAGHPPGGRQADSPRPRGQGGRPLAHLRLCRRGGSRPRPTPASARCAIFSREAQESPVRKYTPAGEDIDAVIDVRAVFQQGHRELAIEAMPSFLLPQKGRYGLRDYEKMFCADLKSGHDIFTMRGIDRERGCMVIVRPDQYVAHVLPLDAHAQLAAFFDGFMMQAEPLTTAAAAE